MNKIENKFNLLKRIQHVNRHLLEKFLKGTLLILAETVAPENLQYA